MFASRWTLLDFLRTLLDFSARGGVLQPQDDLPVPTEAEQPVIVPELPYDRMLRRLAIIDVDVVDYRQRVRSKGSRGEAKGTRKLAKCTAIIWHQMATMLSYVEQCMGIPVHICILEDVVVLCHPLRAYLYAGHASNSFGVHVEVECRAAGIEGNPATFWRSSRERNGYTDKRGRRHPPRAYGELVHEATDRQLKATGIVADYIVEEVERQAEAERLEGKKVPGIVAQGFHRNSRDDRTSDPGSRIALAVQPVAEKHGHEYGGPVVGSGTKTPTVWGGAPGQPYSWRVKGY